MKPVGRIPRCPTQKVSIQVFDFPTQNNHSDFDETLILAADNSAILYRIHPWFMTSQVVSSNWPPVPFMKAPVVTRKKTKRQFRAFFDRVQSQWQERFQLAQEEISATSD